MKNIRYRPGWIRIVNNNNLHRSGVSQIYYLTILYIILILLNNYTLAPPRCHIIASTKAPVRKTLSFLFKDLLWILAIPLWERLGCPWSPHPRQVSRAKLLKETLATLNKSPEIHLISTVSSLLSKWKCPAYAAHAINSPKSHRKRLASPEDRLKKISATRYVAFQCWAADMTCSSAMKF